MAAKKKGSKKKGSKKTRSKGTIGPKEGYLEYDNTIERGPGSRGNPPSSPTPKPPKRGHPKMQPRGPQRRRRG